MADIHNQMKRYTIIIFVAVHQVLGQQRDSSYNNFGNAHSPFNHDSNGYISQNSQRHEDYRPLMSLPPPPPTSAPRIQQNLERYQHNDQPTHHQGFLNTGSKKLVSFSYSSNHFDPTRNQARIPLPEPPRTVLPPIQFTKTPRIIPEREQFESFTQPTINRQYSPIYNDYKPITESPKIEQEQPNFNFKLKPPPPLQFSPRREIVKEEEYEYNRKTHYTTEFTPKYKYRDETEFEIDRRPNNRRDQYKPMPTLKPPPRFDHMWEGEFEDTFGPIILEDSNQYEDDSNRQDQYRHRNEYISTTERPRFQTPPVRRTERPRKDYQKDELESFTERSIERQITLDNNNDRKYTESPRQDYNINERNVQRNPLPKRIPPRREQLQDEDEFRWFTRLPSTTEYSTKYDYIDDFDYQNEPLTNNRRGELKPLPTLAPPPRLQQAWEEDDITTLRPIIVKEMPKYNNKEQNIDRNRYIPDRTMETPKRKPVPQRSTNVPRRNDERQSLEGVTQRSVQKKYTPNPFDFLQYPDLMEENNLDDRILKPLTPLRFPSKNEQMRREYEDNTFTKPSATTEYTPKRGGKEESDYTIEQKSNNRRNEFKSQFNHKLQAKIEHVKVEEHTTTVKAIIDQQTASNYTDMRPGQEIPGIDFRLRIPIRKPGIFSREQDNRAPVANAERPPLQGRQDPKDLSRQHSKLGIRNTSPQSELNFTPVSDVTDQPVQRSRPTNSWRRTPALTEYSKRHRAREESNREQNSYTTDTDDSDNEGNYMHREYESRYTVAEKPKIDRKSLLRTIGPTRPTAVTGAQPVPAGTRSSRSTKTTDYSGNEGNFRRRTEYEQQYVLMEKPKIDRKSLLRTIGPTRPTAITGAQAIPAITRSSRGANATEFDELMEELMRKTKLINDNRSEESTTDKSDTTTEKPKFDRKSLLRTIGPTRPAVTNARPVPMIRPFIRNTTSRPRRIYHNQQRSKAENAEHGTRIARQIVSVQRESVSEKSKIDRRALLRTIGPTRPVVTDSRRTPVARPMPVILH